MFVTFLLLFGYFFVTFGSTPRVTFSLLFRYFEFFRVSALWDLLPLTTLALDTCVSIFNCQFSPTSLGRKREFLGIHLCVFSLSGMFRQSASLAIPHRKSFAAIPSLSLGSLGTWIATSTWHTNRSMKLPPFRHFQDQVLTTDKEKWGKKDGPVFCKVCVFDVSRAVGIARFESVSELQLHCTIQCH